MEVINRIEESEIIGLHLGWIVPEDGRWQALMKLTKSACGYESSHTRAYQRLAYKLFRSIQIDRL
jgi:hypothetical protein